MSNTDPHCPHMVDFLLDIIHRSRDPEEHKESLDLFAALAYGAAHYALLLPPEEREHFVYLLTRPRRARP